LFCLRGRRRPHGFTFRSGRWGGSKILRATAYTRVRAGASLFSVPTNFVKALHRKCDTSRGRRCRKALHESARVTMMFCWHTRPSHERGGPACLSALVKALQNRRCRTALHESARVTTVFCWYTRLSHERGRPADLSAFVKALSKNGTRHVVDGGKKRSTSWCGSPCFVCTGNCSPSNYLRSSIQHNKVESRRLSRQTPSPT
jgi:hypothetical protein